MIVSKQKSVIQIHEDHGGGEAILEHSFNLITKKEKYRLWLPDKEHPMEDKLENLVDLIYMLERAEQCFDCGKLGEVVCFECVVDS